MENTEIHWEMQIKEDNGDMWNEELEGCRYLGLNEPENDEEAIQHAQAIIAMYNRTIKDKELERKLVTVQRIETKVIDLLPADLD